MKPPPSRLEKLAKRYNLTVDKMDEVLSGHAKRIVEAAGGAQSRCPEDDKGKCWLESYMAMNAGSDKMARKVIEEKCWKLFGEGF